jgi:hypothetical protein
MISLKKSTTMAYDADSGVNSVQYYKLINLETTTLGSNQTAAVHDDEAFELLQNLLKPLFADRVRRRSA